MFLDRLDLLDYGVHGLSHLFMHGHGIITLYEVRLPAAASEVAFQLLVRDTREDGGVADLVSVQMENGKNRSVCNGI